MFEYSEKVMDHFLNPRNAGKMEDADAVGQVGSLACGDSMSLAIKVDPETEMITDAKFLTFGCASAIASASKMTELVIGKTVEEALKITSEDIAAELGGLPDAKIHCSVLGADALKAAVAKYRGEKDYTEEDIVCHCFGVTRSKIEEVVRDHGLSTVEEVTNHTKAGGACGKCKGDIEAIIAGIRGDGAGGSRDEPPKSGKMTNLQRIHLIEKTIEEEIRPALRADGGGIRLVDVDGAKVTVRLTGRCSGCPVSGKTLKEFVQSKLQAAVGEELTVIEEE